VYDEMTELMKDQMSKLKVGDPTSEDTDVGPIARADLREELHRQIKSTIEHGGTCLLGGEMPEGDGFFYPVTLLAGVKPGMAAFTEETFGPVGVMIRASDEAHAMSMANDTEYGLAASIWTEAGRGEALASQLDTGQVSVNGIVKTDPRLPSGGTKSSGLGRELGPHGIKEFVNAQQVWVGPAKS
ncbi:MAG: aldehyde dehydrogenase family protein, partial [Henriciella sp.]|uniref:aldehyde dehydrogenase family protein n=1 Tax=Henriciella sp. TaxID=1968823 RepID=UPI003C7475FE